MADIGTSIFGLIGQGATSYVQKSLTPATKPGQPAATSKAKGPSPTIFNYQNAPSTAGFLQGVLSASVKTYFDQQLGMQEQSVKDYYASLTAQANFTSNQWNKLLPTIQKTEQTVGSIISKLQSIQTGLTNLSNLVNQVGIDAQKGTPASQLVSYNYSFDAQLAGLNITAYQSSNVQGLLSPNGAAVSKTVQVSIRGATQTIIGYNPGSTYTITDSTGKVWAPNSTGTVLQQYSNYQLGTTTNFGANLSDGGLKVISTGTPTSNNFATATTAVGGSAAGGTLTFTGGFATTSVNYTNTATLNSVITAINGNATLSAAGVTASLTADGQHLKLAGSVSVADSQGTLFNDASGYATATTAATTSGTLTVAGVALPYTAGTTTPTSIAASINGNATLSTAGITATVNSSNQLVITGAGATISDSAHAFFNPVTASSNYVAFETGATTGNPTTYSGTLTKNGLGVGNAWQYDLTTAAGRTTALADIASAQGAISAALATYQANLATSLFYEKQANTAQKRAMSDAAGLFAQQNDQIQKLEFKYAAAYQGTLKTLQNSSGSLTVAYLGATLAPASPLVQSIINATA